MWKGKAYQFFTTFALGIGSISMGLLFVWPSYTLPMLAASNNTILSAPLDESEEAMLGSLPSLGAMVGSAIVPLLISIFGRKMGSIFMSLCYVICWMMVIFTRSIIVILIARFLGGIAGGATDCIGPIYLSEVANDNIRGALVLVLLLMYSFGMIMSYFIGWYCDYFTIAYVNLGIAIFRVLVLLAVRDSPVYLMKKKRVDDARRSIASFQGVSPNSLIVEEEINKIRQQISSTAPQDFMNEKGEIHEKNNLTSEMGEFKKPRKRFAALIELCTSPASRRAFLIVFMCYTFQILMGNLPVSVYAKQVFDEYDPSSADLNSVIFSVCWCSGLLLSSVVTDRFGRRVIMMTSSLLVAICLVILGVLFQTKCAPASASVAMIMVFIFCYMFGAAAIPYVLMAELFCREVQTLASTLLVQWSWLGTFFILAIFQWLTSLIGIYGTFYIFAFNSLLSVAFTYFVIPETSGISNKEIQVLLYTGQIK